MYLMADECVWVQIWIVFFLCWYFSIQNRFTAIKLGEKKSPSIKQRSVLLPMKLWRPKETIRIKTKSKQIWNVRHKNNNCYVVQNIPFVHFFLSVFLALIKTISRLRCYISYIVSMYTSKWTWRNIRYEKVHRNDAENIYIIFSTHINAKCLIHTFYSLWYAVDTDRRIAHCTHLITFQISNCYCSCFCLFFFFFVRFFSLRVFIVE